VLNREDLEGIDLSRQLRRRFTLFDVEHPTQEHQMKAMQRLAEFVSAQKIAAAERNPRTVSLAVQ
jgi:hypothetical protein